MRDCPEKTLMVDWALETIYLSVYPYVDALRKPS